MFNLVDSDSEVETSKYVDTIQVVSSPEKKPSPKKNAKNTSSALNDDLSTDSEHEVIIKRKKKRRADAKPVAVSDLFEVIHHGPKHKIPLVKADPVGSDESERKKNQKVKVLRIDSESESVSEDEVLITSVAEKKRTVKIPSLSPSPEPELRLSSFNKEIYKLQQKRHIPKIKGDFTDISSTRPDVELDPVLKNIETNAKHIDATEPCGTIIVKLSFYKEKINQAMADPFEKLFPAVNKLLSKPDHNSDLVLLHNLTPLFPHGTPASIEMKSADVILCLNQAEYQEYLDAYDRGVKEAVTRRDSDEELESNSFVINVILKDRDPLRLKVKPSSSISAVSMAILKQCKLDPLKNRAVISFDGEVLNDLESTIADTGIEAQDQIEARICEGEFAPTAPAETAVNKPCPRPAVSDPVDQDTPGTFRISAVEAGGLNRIFHVRVEPASFLILTVQKTPIVSIYKSFHSFLGLAPSQQLKLVWNGVLLDPRRKTISDYPGIKQDSRFEGVVF